MKMIDMIDNGPKRKGFTVIEGCIVIAIIAIILAIVIPALSKKPTPSGQPVYEDRDGWTFVVEAPYGRLYMKRVPERHITVYWNTHNGNMQVVNDRD